MTADRTGRGSTSHYTLIVHKHKQVIYNKALAAYLTVALRYANWLHQIKALCLNDHFITLHSKYQTKKNARSSNDHHHTWLTSLKILKGSTLLLYL